MNGICDGKCELKMTRPTVVWMNWRSIFTGSVCVTSWLSYAVFRSITSPV